MEKIEMSKREAPTQIFLQRSDCSLVLSQGDQTLEVRLGFIQAFGLAQGLIDVVQGLMLENMQKPDEEWTAERQHLN